MQLQKSKTKEVNNLMNTKKEEHSKHFMSIREAGRFLGVGESFLRQRKVDNCLPGVDVGTHYRVNVPVLCEMLDDECRQAMPTKEVGISE